MTQNEPLLIVVVGPTAAGKTALAMALAQHLALPAIVSADARQVYRQLNIGTGKPSAEELARVPHRLVDIIAPDGTYNAADFAADAAREIAALHAASDTAIVCGGAGFYLAALLEGLPELPAADPALRAEFQDILMTQGLAPLLAELQAADPEAYRVIDRQNPVRVMRALDVIRQTGRPFSSFRAQPPILPYRTLWLGVDPGVEPLREVIRQRVAAMFDAGLVAEVQGLLAQGYAPDLQSLQTIGYREVLPFLRGEQTEAEALAAVQVASIQYAKRQRTWFATRKQIHWLVGQTTEQRLAEALSLLDTLRRR